jgi:hypothetical protein
MRVRDGGTTHEGRQAIAAGNTLGLVVGVAAVVVAAPVLIILGLCGLAGSSRHW